MKRLTYFAIFLILLCISGTYNIVKNNTIYATASVDVKRGYIGKYPIESGSKPIPIPNSIDLDTHCQIPRVYYYNRCVYVFYRSTNASYVMRIFNITSGEWSKEYVIFNASNSQSIHYRGKLAFVFDTKNNLIHFILGVYDLSLIHI